MTSHNTRLASHEKQSAQTRCLRNVAVLHAACNRQPSLLTVLVIDRHKIYCSLQSPASERRLAGGGQHRLAGKPPATLCIHLRNAVPAQRIRRHCHCEHRLSGIIHENQCISAAHSHSEAQLPGGEACCGSQEGGDVGVLRHCLQNGPGPLDRVQQLQRSNSDGC